MKARLKIEKDDEILYAHDYDIFDAESFGRACADAWAQLRAHRFERATSIGALMEELDDRLLDELHGAHFSFTKG